MARPTEHDREFLIQLKRWFPNILQDPGMHWTKHKPPCHVIGGMVFIDKDMALVMADKPALDQRNRIDKAIERYAHIMTAYRWLFTAETIAIDDTGRVIDGMNRLHGVIRSGKGQWFYVIIGIPVTQVTPAGTFRTIHVVGQGAVRTLAQQMEAVGIEDSHIKAPAVKCLQTIIAPGRMTNDVGMHLYGTYESHIETLYKDWSPTDGVSSAHILGALAFAHASGYVKGAGPLSEKIARDMVLHLAGSPRVDKMYSVWSDYLSHNAAHPEAAGGSSLGRISRDITLLTIHKKLHGGAVPKGSPEAIVAHLTEERNTKNIRKIISDFSGTKKHRRIIDDILEFINGAELDEG